MMYTNPYQPRMMPLPSAYQPINGVIKVNGRDSAMQYQLPPNSMSPALFDNNGKTFYIVSTDGAGTRTVEAFDYVPHVKEPPQMDDTFVSRAEFDDAISKLREAIDGIHGPVQPEA